MAEAEMAPMEGAEAPRLPEAVRRLAAADPVLAGLAERFELPALERDQRLFRTLARAIVSQQLSGAVAAAIMGRLEALFPADVPLDPAGLAARSADELRGAGLSRAKVAALHDLAAHVLDGRLDLVRLGALDDEAVIEQLIAVRGIGRWTAEMFLIFSLGRPDVLPVDDYGIRKAVKRAYDLPELPTKRELTVLAEPWRPYRSVASLLLWRSLDNRPVRRPTAG